MTIWALRLAVLALTLGFTVTGQAMAETDDSGISDSDSATGGDDEGVTDDSGAPESGTTTEDDATTDGGDFSTTDDDSTLNDDPADFGGHYDGTDGDIRTTAAQSGAVNSLQGGNGAGACVGFPRAHVCKQ